MRMAQIKPQMTASLKDFLILLKPKISLLNVLTGLTAYLLAGGDWLRLPFFMLSGFLAASGSGAMNHVLDAKTDSLMSRTSKRPIPAGRVSPRTALVLGLSIVVAGLVTSVTVFNILTALLIGLGVFVYVVVYTVWLKPRSELNIVIGGLSGSFPPLAGWAAASNTLHELPILLALLIFLWTPGHFWPLAMRAVEDYSRAGVPMLPVKKGLKFTAWASLLLNILTVATSLLIVFYVKSPYIYLFLLLPFSVWLLYASIMAVKTVSPKASWHVFKASSPWLFTVCTALILSETLA